MNSSYGGIYRQCPTCEKITCKLVKGDPLHGLWECEGRSGGWVDSAYSHDPGLVTVYNSYWSHTAHKCPGLIDERVPCEDAEIKLYVIDEADAMAPGFCDSMNQSAAFGCIDEQVQEPTPSPDEDDFWQAIMPDSDCSACPCLYPRCGFNDTADIGCWEIVRDYYHANFKGKEGGK